MLVSKDGKKLITKVEFISVSFLLLMRTLSVEFFARTMMMEPVNFLTLRLAGVRVTPRLHLSVIVFC